MKKISLLLASAVVSLTGAYATTVIPPTFDQLVDQAQVIFQGSVTDVKSQWVGEGAQRHILSYITFHIEDAVKGEPGETYSIRMLGGTVDGETMEVADAPKFKVGDRDILFVENNGSQFVPLVGIMFGRFHVEREQSGQEVVKANGGDPVKNLARLGKEDAEASPSGEPNLTATSFKAAVRAKLQAAK